MILSSTSVMFITWRKASPAQPQKPPQNVDLEKSAEVPDVAVVVDRRPAGIHAQRLAVGRLQRIKLSREGIKQAEGHRLGGSFASPAPDAHLEPRPLAHRASTFCRIAAYSIVAARVPSRAHAAGFIATCDSSHHRRPAHRDQHEQRPPAKYCDVSGTALRPSHDGRAHSQQHQPPDRQSIYRRASA